MRGLLKALGALAWGLALAGCYMSPAKAAAPVAALPAPGHFAGKLALVPLQDKTHAVTRDGRQLWAIFQAASFRPATGSIAGDVITLHQGAVTDLASIPRLVSNVFPPDGPWVEAAVFHDLCYQTQGTFVLWKRPGHTRAAPYTRAECDDLLRQGMVALNISAFQRVTIYEAVRVGGSKGWGH